MRFKRFYTLFILSVFISIGCQSNTNENQKNTELKPASYFPEFNSVSKKYIKEKKINCLDFYKNELNPNRFSGMFLVAKNGKIIVEKYAGFAKYKEKIKMSSETPIHLASISKVGTALAILRLADHKKIHLDEDIRTYLPEFPYPGISVRMLLNHRSGIPYYGYYSFHTWNLGVDMRNIDVLKLLVKHKFPLNFLAGKHFAYCNTNFALLALIIERITKTSFPKAMKELVFNPLKMNHSFIKNYYQDVEELSQSYNSNYTRQGFDYLDDVYGDKNMYSTVQDLLKMDMGTYSNNFLSDSLRKQMYKGYSYERPGKSNYGLGMRMVELPGKSTYFFHTGWWHGNTGCYASLRADTVCIIAISNAYNRSVYRIKRLSPYFGDYPFEFKDEE